MTKKGLDSGGEETETQYRVSVGLSGLISYSFLYDGGSEEWYPDHRELWIYRFNPKFGFLTTRSIIYSPHPPEWFVDAIENEELLRS